MQLLWVFWFCNLQKDSLALEKAQWFLFHIALRETAEKEPIESMELIFLHTFSLAVLQGDVQVKLKIHCSYYKHPYVIEGVIYC